MDQGITKRQDYHADFDLHTQIFMEPERNIPGSSLQIEPHAYTAAYADPESGRRQGRTHMYTP
jgi:hypothetical protein